MKRPFGIDHPLVTVRHHEPVRRQYERLGFAPSPVFRHPWGTQTCVMMFEDNFIELIGVRDASKFGTDSVNGFCFGRTLGQFLEREEGLSLIALHSTNAQQDQAVLVQRGLPSQGIIDFRRETLRADGTPDVAIVSLGLFFNEQHRDVSHFICQQHRPELVWLPEWQRHPNGACGIAEVCYLAEEPVQLVPRLAAICTADRITSHRGVVTAETGCGGFRVLTREGALAHYGDVLLPLRDSATQPHGIAITIRTRRFDRLQELWRESGVSFRQSPRGTLLIDPTDCGNVILEFVPEST